MADPDPAESPLPRNAAQPFPIPVRDEEKGNPVSASDSHVRRRAGEVRKGNQKKDKVQDLFEATKRGDVKAVTELLQEQNLSPDVFNKEGQPPLVIALLEGHDHVVRVLLEFKASHFYQDKQGNTLLHIVAGRGNYAALKVFLDFVQLSEMNAQNQDGNTCLMSPSEQGFFIVVECLLKHRADPNIPNHVGRTPIMAAASKGQKEVVKALLKHRADVLMASHECREPTILQEYSGMPTAMREALTNGSTELISLVAQACNEAARMIRDLFTCKTREDVQNLTSRGVSVNQRRGDGCTPLMIHAELGNVEVVTYLIEKHALLDAQDNNGQTALMKSASRGHINIVKVLVEKQALIDIRCKSGLSAQDIARQNGCMDIEKYLKEEGVKKQDPFISLLGQYLKTKTPTERKVLSVELCHTQEDLDREKRASEIKRNKTEIEFEQVQRQKETKENVLQGKAETTKEFIRLTEILNKIIEQGMIKEDIHRMTAGGQQMFNAKDLLDLILNGRKKAHVRAALVAFTGLPKSGKSTLLKTLLPPSLSSKDHVHGLATYEIGIPIPPGGTISESSWKEFRQEDAHIYMLAYALADACRSKIPSLHPWSDNDLPQNFFKSEHLRNEFKKVYEKMTKVLPKVTESPYFHCILKPMVIFMNVWDVGVSKALYEALPLLARVTNPLVLINLLDLARDSDKLRESPKLNSENEGEFVMKFRSRCHYYVRIAGLCTCKSEEVPASLLVATHKDQVPKDKINRLARLTEAIINAKAGDMGISDALCPKMMAIDARDMKDCKPVQHVLEKIVCSSNQFEKDLHLTWIFLRTALMDYKTKSRFLISYNELSELAMQCGLTSQKEVDKFLTFFTQIGSLFFMKEFFHENIIYKLDIFFEELNKLYINAEDQYHAKTSLQQGILCRHVAGEFWKEDMEFFWNILQESGLAAALANDKNASEKYDYNIKCPYESCNEKGCLFIPSLRKNYKKRAPNVKVDSLFITFNSEYVPTDIQAVIVRHMRSALPDANLRLTTEYNSTTFDIGGVSVEVMVHGDVVEMMTECKKPEVLGSLKHLCVQILEAVIVYFPGMEYELGFICPNSEESDPLQRSQVHYVHFLPTQYETELYCVHCHESIPLRPGQLEWMRDAENAQIKNKSIDCPIGLAEAGMVTDYTLASVVKLIPFEHCLSVCATLGLPNPEFVSPSMVSTHLESGLKNWQVASPANRRQKLAKVLFLHGSYVAALKLDAKLIHANINKDAREPLSPLEVETVSQFITDWKMLCLHLNVSEDEVREIESANRRNRDCCRKLLEAAAVSKGKMIDILEDMEYFALADTLMCETLISNYVPR